MSMRWCLFSCEDAFMLLLFFLSSITTLEKIEESGRGKTFNRTISPVKDLPGMCCLNVFRQLLKPRASRCSGERGQVSWVRPEGRMDQAYRQLAQSSPWVLKGTHIADEMRGQEKPSSMSLLEACSCPGLFYRPAVLTSLNLIFPVALVLTLNIKSPLLLSTQGSFGNCKRLV